MELIPANTNNIFAFASMLLLLFMSLRYYYSLSTANGAGKYIVPRLLVVAGGAGKIIILDKRPIFIVMTRLVLTLTLILIRCLTGLPLDLGS